MCRLTFSLASWLVATAVFLVPSRGLHGQQQNSQMGEQVLSVEQAPADAPKKRGPDHPWIELSNLRKGNAPFPGLQVDYKVIAGNAEDITLVIMSKQGRSTARIGPLGHQPNSISIQDSAIFGLPDNCEVWAEVGRIPLIDRGAGYKVSKSVTLGNVGQLTFAREWRPEEAEAYARQQKMKAPPPPVPAGSVVVDARTEPLLPGMPVLGTWLGEWHEGELVAATPLLLSIKWSKALADRPAVSSMGRSRVAVATATLEKGRTAPSTFKPSVTVLEGGRLPLERGLVPLTADIVIVPGTPLKAEWLGRFASVTAIAESRGADVSIRWDERMNRTIENRNIGTLAIEQQTLDRLQQPDATEFFAKQLDKLEKSAARSNRHVHDYAIRLALPPDTVRLQNRLAIPRGTSLQVEWANRWHSLRVISNSEVGAVECNWKDFLSGRRTEWISRDSLVIAEIDQARLLANGKGDDPKTETPELGKKPAAGVPPAAEGAGATVPMGGKFEVILEEIGAGKRVPVAKAVMKIAGIGLKDALQLADALPISLKGSLTEAEAKGFQTQIETAGGKASVKSK